jgi:hypothetical protein
MSEVDVFLKSVLENWNWNLKWELE